MTTIRIDNAQSVSDSKQSTAYYIELECVGIKHVHQKKLNSFNLPQVRNEGNNNWTNGPDPKSLDILDVEQKFIITAWVDADSNKNASWVTSSVADVRIVEDRLFSLQDFGGTVTLTVGTTTDGYSLTRTYEVNILRMQTEELSEDANVATKMRVTMDCMVTSDL